MQHAIACDSHPQTIERLTRERDELRGMFAAQAKTHGETLADISNRRGPELDDRRNANRIKARLRKLRAHILDVEKAVNGWTGVSV